MTPTSLSSSFGPSAWGAFDVAAAAPAPAAVDQQALLSRFDGGGQVLGISATPPASTVAEFRDRLLACLCDPG